MPVPPLGATCPLSDLADHCGDLADLIDIVTSFSHRAEPLHCVHVQFLVLLHVHTRASHFVRTHGLLRLASHSPEGWMAAPLAVA